MPKPKKQQEGHGVYSLAYDDGHKVYFARVWYRGREYVESCGESLKKAKDKAGALRTEIALARERNEEWIPPNQRVAAERGIEVQTVEQFAKSFLKAFRGKDATRDFYTYRLKFVTKHLGRRPLTSLTEADCEKFYASRRREAKSITTANHDMKVLRILLGHAVRKKIIRTNPAAGITREADHERPERFLYAEEYQALLEKAKTFEVCQEPDDTMWLHDLVVGAVHSGLRQGNLLALSFSRHVDMSRRIITFMGSETKGGKKVVIPVNDVLYAVLKRRKEATVQHKDGLVFLRRGHAITPSVVKRPWGRLLKAAGVTGFRFHDLRHTCASWAVMAGVPLYDVQKILGHSTVRVTEKYAHLAPDRLRESTRALATFAPPRRNEDRDIDRDIVGGGSANLVEPRGIEPLTS